jgi:uncharacterized protein YuzE
MTRPKQPCITLQLDKETLAPLTSYITLRDSKTTLVETVPLYSIAGDSNLPDEVILDFDENGKIIGIEILGPQEFLEELKEKLLGEKSD